MNKMIKVLFFMGVAMVAVTVLAGPELNDQKKKGYNSEAREDKVYTLGEIADIVEKNKNILTIVKRDYADKKVRVNIDPDNLDFERLYAQLDVHNYAIINSKSSIRIVYSREAKYSAIKMVDANGDYNDHEWVTDVIALKKICPFQLGYIRPLLRVYSGMSTFDSSRIVLITETYSNTVRIRNIIEEMERNVTKRIKDCESARVKHRKNNIETTLLKPKPAK